MMTERLSAGRLCGRHSLLTAVALVIHAAYLGGPMGCLIVELE